MTTNGSFYQNGLPLSTAETGIGNLPTGAPVANKASSSFYLSGTVYQTLANQDALLAMITQDTGLVVADLVLANVAAANAQTSATAAAATLASSLKIASNLSDLSSVPTALISLGLQNVTNTSDVNKPVSTAQATADALVASNAAAATALKANIASPTLTGVPAAPTAAALNNSTQLATTAYADAATAVLSGTVTTALALKAPLASPTLTGTPAAPTATAGTNTTQLATTAYATAADTAVLSTVNTSLALKAPLASPTFTGVPAAPTPATSDNSTTLATTAYVKANIAGSGVSSIAGNTGAFTLGGLLTNATNVLNVTAAVKTDQVAATSAVLAVTPLHQQDHDSALKAHGAWTVSGGVVTALTNNFNITLTRSAAGTFTASFTTPFASANYDCVATATYVTGAFTSSGAWAVITPGSRAAGSIGITTLTPGSSGGSADPSEIHIQCAGRQ